MAGFCLMPEAITRFRVGLKTGAIDPVKLSTMTSEERNKFFEDYVGRTNAKDVNSLFESKLLLKNQQQGFQTWAKSVAGLTEKARTDMISKIGRMDKILDPEDKQSFLKDLAETKLGVGVTQEEAKTIADLSKKVQSAKDSMDAGGDRLPYGRAKVALSNYVNDLKIQAQKLSYKGNPLKTTGRVIARLPGEAKAINASMDNSAIFRQGWKTLWTNPTVWQRNARASFVNLVKQFGGKNVMDEVHADIVSRPTYDKMLKAKLAVGNLEEAFPTTAPEKIPIFGRAYKATEAAYTAFVQKTRADVFDKYMEIAEKSGVDTTDEVQLKAIGNLVNSLTGRGNLGAAESIADKVNNVFFSPRFLKSNIDMLSQPFGAGGAKTAFARKQAAINLVKVVSGVSAIMTIANGVKPGSVELDPRSSDFGKIKVGDTRFDITASVGSIITLASRVITNSSKSTTTGQVNKLNSSKPGSQTSTDVINNFIDNKLSPAAGVVRDMANRQNTSTGTKATIGNETLNLITPIGIQNYEQMKNDPKAANNLLTLIVDGLGISANTYNATQSGQSPWLTSTSKEITQFKSKVNGAQFKQAAAQYNTKLNDYLTSIKTNKGYQKLPQADQQTVITEEKAKLQKDIFAEYGFHYKQGPSKSAQLKKFLK